jgi:hypothetical protein
MINIRKAYRIGRRRRLAVAGLLSLAAMAAPAWAIDTQPFDYATLDPGTNVLIGYFAHDRYDRYVNAQGEQTRAGTALETNVGILRVGHWTEVAGMTTVINVLLPFGQYTDGRLGGNRLSGIHDTQLGNFRLNTTVFFIDDDQKNQRLGLGVYIDAPTGSYKRSRDLNLGDDRWSGTLQLGYLQGLTSRLSLELVGEAAWRADNRNATSDGRTLSQDQTYGLQGWLNYSWAPGAFASVGYSASNGGRAYLDDVATGSRTDSRTLRIAGGIALGKTTFLAAEVDRPNSVRGGFQRDVGVLLRLVKIL